MILAFEAYATAYDALSIFMPFSVLRRGRVAASKSIMMKTAGRIHVVNIVNGARRKYLALFLISGAVLVATFLSTIVAALYQIQPYLAPNPITLTITDQFNYTFPSKNSDNAPPGQSAAVLLGLIEQQNASYPPLVYDELVFPAFSVPSHPTSGNQSIVVDLPATRAALRCDFAPSESLDIGYYDPNFAIWPYGAVVGANTLNLPKGCNWTGLANGPGRGPSVDIGLQNPYEGSYGSAIVNIAWTGTTTQEERQINSTCYSVGFIFGYFQWQNTHKSNITLMNCYQDIELVNTTTTFLPSMRIDPSNPPVIHEQTRRTVASGIVYHMSQVLEFGMMDYHIKGIDDQPGSTGLYFGQTDIPMEPFYQTVVYGPDGVPANELAGLDGQAKLFNSTQHIYRRFMALLINSSLRDPLSSSDSPPPTLQGELIDSTALRLVQNRASKLALQILLATMLVCTALAYIMTPTQSVLPHNPCTIAGVFALLAGSDLCTRAVVPQGAEFMSDKALEKIFEGYLFSMGWHGGEEGTEARFGIDIGRVEKAR